MVDARSRSRPRTTRTRMSGLVCAAAIRLKTQVWLSKLQRFYEQDSLSLEKTSSKDLRLLCIRVVSNSLGITRRFYWTEHTIHRELRLCRSFCKNLDGTR